MYLIFFPEDIFSPPPFPSKDNDRSSDEERSDSSSDIFSFNKPVSNVSNKRKDEANNDKNDLEYDKSQKPWQQNEIATSKCDFCVGTFSKKRYLIEINPVQIFIIILYSVSPPPTS